MTMETVLCEGQLEKRSHHFPFVWQKRWYRLCENERDWRQSYLAYYKDQAHSKPDQKKGHIVIGEILGLEPKSKKANECRMELEVTTSGRKIQLKSGTARLATGWIKAVKSMLLRKGSKSTSKNKVVDVPQGERDAMKRVESSVYEGLRYFTAVIVSGKEHFQGFAEATDHDGYFDVAVFASNFIRFYKLVSNLPRNFNIDDSKQLKLETVASIDHAEKKFTILIREAHKSGLKEGLTGQDFDKALTEASAHSVEGLQEFVKAALKYKDVMVLSKLNVLIGFLKTMMA